VDGLHVFCIHGRHDERASQRTLCLLGDRTWIQTDAVITLATGITHFNDVPSAPVVLTHLNGVHTPTSDRAGWTNVIDALAVIARICPFAFCGDESGSHRVAFGCFCWRRALG